MESSDVEDIGETDELYLCNFCKKLLPKTEFYSYRLGKCKQCIKEYRDAHKDRKLEYDKVYREVNKDYIRERQRAYYYDHIDEIREYRRKNSKVLYEKNKEYARSHPHKIWAKSSIHSHKKRGYDIDLTIDELELIAKNTIVCPICGVTLDYDQRKRSKCGPSKNSPSMDRIYNETSINKDNVWIICLSCNASKQDRSMLEFVDYCKQVVDVYGGV